MDYSEIPGAIGGWIRGQEAKVASMPGAVGDFYRKASSGLRGAASVASDAVGAASDGVKAFVNPPEGAQTVAGRQSGVPEAEIAPERGAPTIGDTIKSAAADSGVTEAEALHPQFRQGMPGINNTISQAAGDLQPPVQPQTLRGSAIPKLSADAAAQARAAGQAPQYIVDGTGGAEPPKPPVVEAAPTGGETPKTPKAPGKIMSGLRTLGRAATPLGVMAGSYDAIKNGTTNMDDTIGRELTSGNQYGSMEGEQKAANEARVMAGLGSDMGPRPDTENTIGRALASSTVSAARRIGNAFDPSPLWGGTANAGDKLVGGIRDLVKGQPFGTTQFEPNPVAPSLRTAQAAPAAGNVPPAAPPTAPTVPTNQGDQTAAQIMSGNAVPDKGFGAIRNNQTGATQTVGSPNGRINEMRKMAAVDSVNTRGGDELAGLRKLQGTPFGDMAALQGAGAISRLKKNDADLSLRRDEAGLRNQQASIANQMAYAEHMRQQANADRTFNQTQENQNREQITKELADHARLVTSPQVTGIISDEKPEAYKERLANAQADITSRVQQSVADRRDGKKLENLAPVERQQLYQADRFKTALEKARNNLGQSARDFIGNKRSDSRNLYDYIPKGVERSTLPGSGGYVVHMGNGNTVSVRDLIGGDFNATGPNAPVNADMLKFVKPLIDDYERNQKGK